MSAKSSMLRVIAAGTVLFGAGLSPAQAEEQGVTAFSVWQIEGPVVQTGENRATFTGVLQGAVYVETDRGPLLAGAMKCPATVEVELDSGRQSATARCTFQASDASRIYADLTCKGVHLVGCGGDFAISGGSGRFAGIQGKGPVIVRGDFREVAIQPGSGVKESVTGIIYWPRLTYSVP